MVRSLIHPSEVLSNRVVYIMFLSVDLDVTCFVLLLNLGDHRVAPLDLEHLVGNPVELLHVPISEQVVRS